MCILAVANSLILSTLSYCLLFILCFTQLVKGTDSFYNGNPKLLTITRNDLEIKPQNVDSVQKEIPRDSIEHFDELEKILSLLRRKKNTPITENDQKEKPKYSELTKLSIPDKANLKKQTSVVKNYFSPLRSKSFNRRLGRIYAFPYVKVIINGRSIVKDLYHSIMITYEPDMSTFRALKMAALKSYRKSRSIENPFNIKIIWNDDLGCEVIHAAAGHTNTYAKKWKIRILRKRGKRVYAGECIPSEALRMRPGTKIVLKYTRT